MKTHFPSNHFKSLIIPRQNIIALTNIELKEVVHLAEQQEICNINRHYQTINFVTWETERTIFRIAFNFSI